MIRIIVAVLLAFVCCNVYCKVILERATKHVYEEVSDTCGKKLDLIGVGVRIKQIGPIKAKVYSTGVYFDKRTALNHLKSFKSIDSEALLKSSEFSEKLIDGPYIKSILIRMARDVSTETMVSALTESVKPRYNKLSSDETPLKTFQSVLSKGLGSGGVKKNSTFCFQSQNQNKELCVCIGGKKQAVINSPQFCKAFMGVYLDDNAVSPTLKADVVNNIHNWL